MKILLVSRDNEAVRRAVGSLQHSGFVVNVYDPDDDLRVALLREEGSAIVLGPDLRGCDARGLIRGLRMAGEERPMLVIASEQLYALRVPLLNTGADDVFAHPCPVEEIAARVKAVVRRSRGLSRPEILLNGLRLDLNARCAMVDTTKVGLTAKEYQILELLAVNRGKVLSKDAIMNHLYDYDAVPDPKIIDVFICKIRKKVMNAGAPEPITTVWGQGYMIREEQVATQVPQQRTQGRKAHRKEEIA